jgi:hypothetical protein
MPAGLLMAILFEIQTREEAMRQASEQRIEAGTRLRVTCASVRRTANGFFVDVPEGDLFPVSDAEALARDKIPFEMVRVEASVDNWGHPVIKQLK